MKLAGIQKLTLLDFPEHTACTVFLAGCNMRCGYCHNQELVVPKCIAKSSHSFIDEKIFFNFLEQRRGLLDGVCITGGEPTLHPALPNFISKIKARNFLVKLDTNGSNSTLLESLINNNLLDYIAMDIKASPQQYHQLTKLPKHLITEITRSKDLIISSGLNHEFRTTLIKETHPENEFLKIINFIKGTPRYFLQNFQKRGGHIDPSFKTFSPLTESELFHFKALAQQLIPHVGIRQ